jgi:hypothetical protein
MLDLKKFRLKVIKILSFKAQISKIQQQEKLKLSLSFEKKKKYSTDLNDQIKLWMNVDAKKKEFKFAKI